MKLGEWGENLTAEKLSAWGYVIIARNWHCRFGEIDIIAQNEEYILFVEVKTRKSANFAQPYESVDYRKQEKIRKTVETYLQQNPSPLQPRLDVASIVAAKGIHSENPEFTYLPQAF
ncbi:MAG: YraN family protein [Eubacteriales bacterium]